MYSNLLARGRVAGARGGLLAVILPWMLAFGGVIGAAEPVATKPPLAKTVASKAAAEPLSAPLAIPTELAESLRPGPPKTVKQLRMLQDQVRRVVALGRPVTVAIEMNDSVGSGVIISADGLVLTAGHVSIEPNREVSVRFPDGHRVKGRSLGVNHELDCGMVRISVPPPSPDDDSSDSAVTGSLPAWPFLPIATEAPKPGDWVVVLGQPNGFVEGRNPPVRLGRVLSIDDQMINTDATLVGGDSGGPLFNLRGEVVGIHSKIGEQITSNYHVPVTAFRREWQRLNDGRMTGVPDGEDPDDWRPFAGLTLREVNGALVVTQVFPRRSAAEAGLLSGDILLEIDGKQPESLAEVDRTIRNSEPYTRVPVVIDRQGTKIELTLWLGRATTDFPGARLDNEDRR
ncbi:S1C family serine protease [Botrimarina mediterranea]|uniref:Periplasmic pH-dependent serine endoprotease DegQ n=1 Tax=Botrimarina mediterranea TaxID=2528022 RepID=A0A518KD31_9BACT|nr:trypsin-like peptidase domain-containing protein [Botrimarina mediterranea]QDV75669.1 Periplasmic pH-dependent serine endoprotease DegQ precursor [Botrimarina mediterranea]